MKVEIPEWFKHQNYGLLDNFDTRQMQELLNEKKHLNELIMSNLNNGDSEVNNGDSKEYARLIFLSTLFNIYFDSIDAYEQFLQNINENDDYEQIEIAALLANSNDSVSDIDFDDFFCLLTKISKTSPNFSEKLGRYLIDLSRRKHKNLINKLESDHQNQQQAYRIKKIYAKEVKMKDYTVTRTTDKFTDIRLLGCDLSASNEKLKKDFNTWLTAQRAVNSKKTYRKLLEYKIIQFLDLDMWRKVIDDKLTYKTICDELYPNKDDTYIAQTIKPLAYEAISDEFIERLTHK